MRERSEQVLRIVCLVLAGLLVLQLGFRVARRDPLANLTIPPLPGLTNAPEEMPPDKGGTNPSSLHREAQFSTNALAKKPGDKTTNDIRLSATAESASNTFGASSSVTGATRVHMSNSTQTISPAVVVAQHQGSTHFAGGSNNPTALASTNLPRLSSSNAALALDLSNSPPSSSSAGTNFATRAGAKPPNIRPGPEAAMAMMGPGGHGPPPKAKPLPPAFQARVDRIVESELLGPVMRPLPMALLGIAGDVAFLRAPNGQTGLVKPGDKLGELKLLEIGVNRVLIEQDGQKKELTMFSGYGGASLLPKPQDNSQ